MTFEKKQHHSYYKPSQITDDFFADLATYFPMEDDFVLDLTAQKITSDCLKKLIATVALQQENKRSFVIVCSDVSIAEDLLLVPTYSEAIDVLELERISRDLGF